MNAEPVTDIVCDLGESPLWSQAEGRLYWIDVSGRRIHSLDPASGRTATFVTTGLPGSIALHGPGSLLVAWRAGLSVLDLASGIETTIPTDVDFSIQRFNDGKADRRGRFFVGTMDRKMESPVGGLYRVGADRKVTRLSDGIRLSNGIAWSPDDRTLYHCDSRPGLVFAWDFEPETGDIANRRLFLDLSATGYHPDGCTVDAEGCLWLAEVGVGAVGRYAPDGRRIGEVVVPGARRVTSVAFGGPGLDTLYITSLRVNIAEADLALQPLAGRLFAVHSGVKGLPETAYAG